MAKKSAGKPADSTAKKDRLFLTQLVDELARDKDLDCEGYVQLLGGGGLAIKIRGVISTRCATADAAIGRGGIPLGRLTILHGMEGSGKTTLALEIVAECQARGGIVMYMDAEHKLDGDYAESLGVKLEDLILSQPPYLERGFAIIERVVGIARARRESANKRIPILIVLDSMNAIQSKTEYDAGWEDQTMAAQARVFSAKLPKLIPIVKREDVALLFISQVREKIGVMFGNKDKTAGGNAPKFYASLLMEIRRVASIKEGGKDGTVVGNRTEVYIGKNQIAPPFRRASFDILFGKGIDRTGALIQRAVELAIVEKSGAWYSFDNERLGQGLAQARDLLDGHENILKAIRKRVHALDLPGG